ncbi:hypothetical protein [Actinoplanes sp. NPDC026619]|uniref:hypothetical protein n=1 Tax=Actinoplanes sp. NPDC026619 TaxID=3155798 RepID=UPI003401259F
MADFEKVLVDTSTLLEVSAFGHVSSARLSGAVEALVLFETIVLDGPSVDMRAPDLRWLEELDRDEIVSEPLDRTAVQDMYRRAVAMFEAIPWSNGLADRFQSHLHRVRETLGGPSELTRYTPVMTERPPPALGVVQHLCGHGIDQPVAEVFTRPFEHPGAGVQESPRLDPALLAEGLANLLRLFYYLALQERTGALLLIHPAKDFGFGIAGDPQENLRWDHFGSNLIAAFDAEVQAAYARRYSRWLGSAPRSMPAPPLTRLVFAQARDKGWSIGRSIMWLRSQPEVRKFRQGLRSLQLLVDAGDKVGVDDVLSELQTAADALSTRLSADVRRRSRFALQASLPLLQPTKEIAIPLPGRSPAQKMLGLMTWASRSE